MEAFKSSSGGEQFIEDWKTSEDGQALRAKYFEAGFKEFLRATKKRFSNLTMNLTSIFLEDLFNNEDTTMVGGGVTDTRKMVGSIEAGEEVDQITCPATTFQTSIDQTFPSTIVLWRLTRQQSQTQSQQGRNFRRFC